MTDFTAHFDMDSFQEENTQAYERFAVTRNLFYHKYHEFILSLNKQEIIEKLSKLLVSRKISDDGFGKLIRRIDRWNKIQIPIPLLYIDFIGLTPESIQDSAKADMKNFKTAMLNPSLVDCFYVETPEGVTRVALPGMISEKEAIRLVKLYVHPSPITARYLFFKELKTIIFENTGNFYTLAWPPLLTLQYNMFIPLQINNPCKGIKL
jgi:hypothetical protein